MAAFATVLDISLLGGRTVSDTEEERAAELLSVISNVLRSYGKRAGKDLDTLAEADEAYADTLRLVTVDVTVRALRQSVTGEPMSQVSQSALGYSMQGTYAIPGGGVAACIMNNDLKRLGLKRQRIGARDIYGVLNGNGDAD